MKQLKIKQYSQRQEEEKLSFRLVELSTDTLLPYTLPHQKDHFCILIVESGQLKLHIEDRTQIIKKGKIAVIFPNQVHDIEALSTDISGRIILFEEVLFCSDILKNELSVYNVNLSTQLNCILMDAAAFEKSLYTVDLIQEIFDHPSLIKKEQARFYIKIFLLTLIESVHGQHPLIGKSNKDQPLYVQFKKLLNTHYKQERTVQYYAHQLAVTPKKLNSITKKHCGETAIGAIHNRILTEIKRQLMFGDTSHKQIALDLGFNSPAALNKFVKAKLNETPTQLQNDLAQMYNT